MCGETFHVVGGDVNLDPSGLRGSSRSDGGPPLDTPQPRPEAAPDEPLRPPAQLRQARRPSEPARGAPAVRVADA